LSDIYIHIILEDGITLVFRDVVVIIVTDIFYWFDFKE